MKIMGLDPARNTGYAVYDIDRHHSSIEAGSIKAKGSSIEESAWSLGQQFQKLFAKHMPDFVAMEMPPRQQFGGTKKMKFMGEEMEGGGQTGLGSILSTNMMAGALMGVVGAYKVPFVIMSAATWRKAAYGFSRKEGWSRKEWKAHSREQCRLEKIQVSNDDAAEAVWIAVAAKTTDAFKYHKRQVAG